MLSTIRTLSIIVLWTTLLVFALAGCGGNGGLSSAGGGNDTTPPTLSNIQTSNRSADSATLTWITDEPADSRLEYGLDINYGSSTSLDANLVATHAVALTGLSSSTLYFYRVISRDASGNETLSGDYSFATGTAHYVRTEATGLNDGTDWTNAHTILPAVLVRGDTYYIADGAYPSYTFNDAESGTDYITIKKAIETGHGTDTGWNSAMGDGQAVISGGIVISTGYWNIDGQVGEKDGSATAYGIKILHPVPTGRGIQLIGSPANITIQYAEVAGNGPDDVGSPADDSVYSLGGSNFTFSHMYIHDPGRVQFLLRGVTDSIIEYSLVARNENYVDQHSEAISAFNGTDNITVRFNTWVDIEGTGVIMHGGDGWEIYGNLIYWTTNYPNTGQSGTGPTNGTIAGWTSQVVTNAKIYNNTIIGTSYSLNNCFSFLNGFSTGIEVKNNLFYNAADGAACTFTNVTTRDYNWYYNSGTQSETNIQNGTGGPFTDIANYNFNLAAGTNAVDTAADPGAAYNTDINGLTRPSGPGWDMGAYEYVP